MIISAPSHFILIYVWRIPVRVQLVIIEIQQRWASVQYVRTLPHPGFQGISSTRTPGYERVAMVEITQYSRVPRVRAIESTQYSGVLVVCTTENTQFSKEYSEYHRVLRGTCPTEHPVSVPFVIDDTQYSGVLQVPILRSTRYCILSTECMCWVPRLATARHSQYFRVPRIPTLKNTQYIRVPRV